jgi:hypothetical protein
VSRFAPSPRSTVLALAIALGLSAPASAQDTESRFSGAVQFDFTNAYFFRGILQEREGAIMQPWAELYYSLYSSDEGFLRGVTVGAGMWTSFHSERTASTHSPGWWYEADYYPLVSFDFANNLNLTTVYYYYTSPNGAFTTAQELNLKLSWDDSDAFGAWSMQPWVNLAIETQNTAFGPHEGVGLQFGVEPTLYTAPNDVFSLSLPVEVGLSLYGYYEGNSNDNHGFGYANAGLAASIPLSFMPEGAGEWSVNLAGKVFVFDEILENANRGKAVYPVGTISLAVAF